LLSCFAVPEETWVTRSVGIFRQTKGGFAGSSLAKTVPNPASESDFRIRFEQHGPKSRVEVSGRINIDSSPEFRASLLRMLRVADCQRLEVSFCEVAYIDSSGLAVLVDVLKCARQLGKKLELSGLQERPRYLLESTGLLSFFVEGRSPCDE
jgi:anti-sigma B factor antagonist